MWRAADRVQHVYAVNLRQIQVEQNEVGRFPSVLLRQIVQRSLTVLKARQIDRDAFFLQRPLDQQNIAGIVFDEHDAGGF